MIPVFIEEETDVEMEKYVSVQKGSDRNAVCHECDQQAAIREGFLEELLFKQRGGAKGGPRPLTLACKANYIHFFPVFHLMTRLLT